MEYPTADETATVGLLPCLNPRGLYEAHLEGCPDCLKAERAGTFCADCPSGIHVHCANAEGAGIVWGAEGPPPEIPGPVKRPWSEPQCAAESADGQYFTATFRELTALGVLTPLTPEQESDRSHCAMIAKCRAHVRTSSSLTAEQIEAVRPTVGGLDIARIVELACTAGRLQYAAYDRACTGGCSGVVEQDGIRADAFESTRLVPGAKRRLVTNLRTTANTHAARMSVEYARISTLMAGALPTDTFLVDDGEKAYHCVPIHPEFRKYFCIQHPVTLDIYRFARQCFGGSQTCTLYSGITAVIKAALRFGPPRVGGAVAVAVNPPAASDVVVSPAGGVGGAAIPADGSTTAAAVIVTGVLDDIAQRIDGTYGQADRQLNWTDSVFERVRFTRSLPKRQGGAAVHFLGGHVDAASSSVTAKGEKLFSTYRDLALIEAAVEASDSRPEQGSAGASRVPFPFFESLVGSLEWLTTFDSSLRLVRPGFRASLEAARRAGGREVLLSSGSPCAGPVRETLQRARAGKARAVRFLPSADVRAITVQCMPSAGRDLAAGDALLQGQVKRAFAADAASGNGRTLHSAAGDASLDAPRADGAPGKRCWGAAWPTSAGAAEMEVAFGEVSGEGWHADSLELVPMLVAMRRNARRWANGAVVFLTDNIGNTFRINRGKAVYRSRAYELLAELYAIADAHNIDFVALWLPRSSNAALDRLSKCRSASEAAAWATGAGYRFVSD